MLKKLSLSGLMMTSSMPSAVLAADEVTASVNSEVSAAESVTDDGIKYEVYDDHAIVVGYTDDINSDLIIAEKINNTPVTGIAKEAFIGCDAIKTVVIPDTIDTVGGGAFRSCSSLTTAEVSYKYMPGFKTSEEWVKWTGIFLFCSSLEKVIYHAPDDDTIDKGCRFSDFLFQVDTITEIPIREAAIYDYNREISRILVPHSFKTIEVKSGQMIPTGDFDNLTTVEDIVLPDTITTIGDSAFGECFSLRNVNLPKSVKYIGDYAFGSCRNIEWGDIVFPEGLEAIGKDAFESNKGITSVELPSSLKKIGACAFGDCLALKNVILKSTPDIVSSFGVMYKDILYGIFQHCPVIENVSLQSDKFTFTDSKGVTTDISAEQALFCSGGLIGSEYEDNFDNPSNNVYIPKTAKITIASSSNLTGTPEKIVYQKGEELDLSGIKTADGKDAVIPPEEIILIGPFSRTQKYTANEFSSLESGKYIVSAGDIKFNVYIEDPDSMERYVQLDNVKVISVDRNSGPWKVRFKGFEEEFKFDGDAGMHADWDGVYCEKGDTVSGVLKVSSQGNYIYTGDLKRIGYGGDANCNGIVDISDAVLIMQSIANPSKYKLTDQGRENADIDNDGITSGDALAIQKKLLKLD